MPTYSYKCTQCGTAFDIVQSFSDDSLTECPTCQGALRKVFSPVGVTFNGSGFYRTDSRGSSSSAKTTGSSSSGGSDSSSGASGSTTSAGTSSGSGVSSTTSTSTGASS